MREFAWINFLQLEKFPPSNPKRQKPYVGELVLDSVSLFESLVQSKIFEVGRGVHTGLQISEKHGFWKEIDQKMGR